MKVVDELVQQFEPSFGSTDVEVRHACFSAQQAAGVSVVHYARQFLRGRISGTCVGNRRPYNDTEFLWGWHRRGKSLAKFSGAVDGGQTSPGAFLFDRRRQRNHGLRR